MGNQNDKMTPEEYDTMITYFAQMKDDQGHGIFKNDTEIKKLVGNYGQLTRGQQLKRKEVLQNEETIGGVVYEAGEIDDFGVDGWCWRLPKAV